jgi:hypothetical protein
MISFNGSLVLEDDTPATLLQLVQAAIAARDYGSAAQTTAAANRFPGQRVTEGFIRPTADIYMIDSYKGIRAGGAVIPADWTTPDDFTDEPGGGELIAADVEKHFNNGGRYAWPGALPELWR